MTQKKSVFREVPCGYEERADGGSLWSKRRACFGRLPVPQKKIVLREVPCCSEEEHAEGGSLWPKRGVR